MKQVLLASPSPASLVPFCEILRSNGAHVSKVSDKEAAMGMAREKRPSLVVWDERMTGGTARQALSELMGMDAFINTAVISDSIPEDFHERYEGMGVLLQVRPENIRSDAQTLWDRLSGLAV